MRASPQDLVHAHALATVAPVDLSDFYVSAAVGTIYPGLRFLSVDEVFINQECIVVRANKTIQELGLDLPGFVWRQHDINQSYDGHAYYYYHRPGAYYRNDVYYYVVYCKEANLNSCRTYVQSEWAEVLSLLDDDEYMVFLEDDMVGIIKLPA